MIQINNLTEDIQATNATRKYRATIRSRQFAKYAHNWWQSSLVLLTRYNNNLSAVEIESGLAAIFDMCHRISNFSGLLIRAIDGELPDYVYRQYANRLPAIVKATGLKYRVNSEDYSGRGRPTKYVFYFKNSEVARNVLLTRFPELLPLFVELDRQTNTTTK